MSGADGSADSELDRWPATRRRRGPFLFLTMVTGSDRFFHEAILFGHLGRPSERGRPFCWGEADTAQQRTAGAHQAMTFDRALRCLEQARPAALDRHVHRTARLGSQVLISESWYEYRRVEVITGQKRRRDWTAEEKAEIGRHYHPQPRRRLSAQDHRPDPIRPSI